MAIHTVLAGFEQRRSPVKTAADPAHPTVRVNLLECRRQDFILISLIIATRYKQQKK